MTLNLKTNFKPIKVKCVVNRFEDLENVVKEKIGQGVLNVNSTFRYKVEEKYFIYGISIDIHGEVEFLPSDSNIFVPAWLFETDYKIPEGWHIKSYMHENNVLHYESYDFHIPNIIMGFKELVCQKDFIINLIEYKKKEREIFESYQEYEKELRQKRAEEEAVKYMYPYEPKT